MLLLGTAGDEAEAAQRVHRDADADAGPHARELLEHLQVDLVRLAASAVLLGVGQPEEAREHPGRIRAIYVRRTGTHDVARLAEVDALAAEVTAAGVPMLAVDDSVQIAEHAASLGLLDAAAVDEVRAETGVVGHRWIR